jgi:hypothetical protein
VGKLAPNAVVTAPAAAAPLHSLLAAAEQPTGEGNRWELGYEFCPESCGRAVAWDWECADPTKPDKPTSATDPDDVSFEPFQVIVDASCDCSRGFASEDYAGRGTRLLEASTPAAVELEFWTGQLKPQNPSLAASGSAECFVLVEGGQALSPKRALAALQHALATCECSPGGRGTIHATTELAALWGYDGYLREDGQRLVTAVRRDVVVAGTGYPGTGPNGVAPGDGQVWAFATSGLVQVRTSSPRVVPDTFAEALDREINRVQYYAERTAGVTWDGCCLAAVLVELDSDVIIDGGP